MYIPQAGSRNKGPGGSRNQGPETKKSCMLDHNGTVKCQPIRTRDGMNTDAVRLTISTLDHMGLIRSELSAFASEVPDRSDSFGRVLYVKHHPEVKQTPSNKPSNTI